MSAANSNGALTKEPSLPQVLIIDDEQGLRDMLAFGLSDRGYHVASAATGEEGLQKANAQPFDLAVCDIMMPGKNGVEVLRELKEIQPEMIVTMATGYATLETAVESMKRGAYDYIAKPYSLDQLCAIFEKAMETKRLRAQVGRLEELNRLKSEFLANMSHELRTPMNAIIPKKILICDDDPAITLLFQTALAKEGYEVSSASGGGEALAAMRREKPDILLLDLMMPGMSGFDVLEIMKAEPPLEEVRVLVMTAKHLTPRETAYLEEHVEMILQKGSRSLSDILSLLKEKLADMKQVCVP